MIHSHANRSRFLPLVIALSACVSTSTPPPETAVPVESTSTEQAGARDNPEPVTTTFAEQVERGQKLYGAHCASCHGDDGAGKGKAPAVVGAGALQRFANAAEVFAYVDENMPGNAPNSLPVDQVLAILAFDLFANGIELEESLTPSNASAITLGTP